jgi:cytochrome c peroxidase
MRTPFPSRRAVLAGACLALLLALPAGPAVAGPLQRGHRHDPLTTSDASGWLRTYTASGTIDEDNPFFQPLGTNGRSCNTCHQQQDAWGLTPATVRARFDATGGTDPLFRTNDGATSPAADVSTVARRRIAYGLLLRRAVFRIGIGLPEGAEFSLVGVDDPYGYASASELSLFRRPLPATNLGFLTAVMWDGRETLAPFLPPMDAGSEQADLAASLRQQATDAVLGHAQGAAPPTDDQLAQIVAFESGLVTAQIRDDRAGLLNEDDALGGPRILAIQRFDVGINDPLGGDPTGAAFDPESMRLFQAWDGDHAPPERRSIARGERLFTGKPIRISGVAGLNDALGQDVVQGTCSTCHNGPNVGNHTITMPLDIGISSASRRTPDLPLYTLRNNATGDTVQTTDPGRALLTGRWADIGKFKGPILRGLAGRAPYFHDGSAATLEDVVDFYDTRFGIGLAPREKRDLVAFLRSL